MYAYGHLAEKAENYREVTVYVKLTRLDKLITEARQQVRSFIINSLENLTTEVRN